VLEIELSADELVSALLNLSLSEPVYLLDSCGVGHLGSHLLIAGVRSVEVHEISNEDPEITLRFLDEKLSTNLAAIFTLSYDFGAKIEKISPKRPSDEPDIFIALLDALIVHDYTSGKTMVVGDEARSREIVDLISDVVPHHEPTSRMSQGIIRSNFSKTEYIDAVETIQDYIRRGDTYQTNLTQQLTFDLPTETNAQGIFSRLRSDHPAPFAAFLTRTTSTVISASPERFFRVKYDRSIEASPIKGTRRRGISSKEDDALRAELQSSEKDRAENTMIVDLLRNDLGRVCEYGSVKVDKLCDIEEHPTLFHLVSTISGRLRADARLSDILRATFPCGSITGAPKIRTMQIIDEIETAPRGLSMGAIGLRIPPSWKSPELDFDTEFDLSVAIRTMVIRGTDASFNVGGGIVIDSNPDDEYDESLLKAKALLNATGLEDHK